MKMHTKQIVLSRLLPKTGCETGYVGGDDGYFQAGWWMGRTVADNKARFVVKTIGLVDVVIDKATGLMWTRDFDGAGGNNGNPVADWGTGVTYCRLLDFAGFSDWRMPNFLELLSIIVFENTHGSPFIQDIFQNRATARIWSSTTHVLILTAALTVRPTDALVLWRSKTENSNQIICVRGGTRVVA